MANSSILGAKLGGQADWVGVPTAVYLEGVELAR
jgi:hypothetical protein